MKVFAFWHDKDKVPAYLQMCFESWQKNITHHEVVLLDYSNIDDYTNVRSQVWWKPLTSGRYNLSAISDVLRIYLLNQYGGLWMDMDTIIVNKNFEKRVLDSGYPQDNRIFATSDGYLTNAFIMSKLVSRFVDHMLETQIDKILNPQDKMGWDYLANSISQPYLDQHSNEFQMMDIRPCWAEWGMYRSFARRQDNYHILYFNQRLSLKNLPSTDILMLHNSWTPHDYIKLSRQDILKRPCTLSNILREVVG